MEKKVESIVLEKQLEKIRELTKKAIGLSDELNSFRAINSELKSQLEKLKHDMAYIKSSTLQAVLAADDKYKRALLSNVTQHDKSVLAMQYRDCYFMYCRIHNTEMRLNDRVMADVNLLLGSHFSDDIYFHDPSS